MVLYTGPGFPECSSPMVLDPLPHSGHPIDTEFASARQGAISANPHVHDGAISANPHLPDGAIMCGRRIEENQFEVTGWSFRLHPPPVDRPQVPNKGSGFNSSLAMSRVEAVDRVLFWSTGAGWCFEGGSIMGLIRN